MKLETYNKYIMKHQHKYATRPTEGELDHLSIVNLEAHNHVLLLLQRCLKHEVEKIRCMKRVRRILEENKASISV